MNIRRGDVVILDWPFASGQGRKPRPALVVQNDLDNQRLVNTILAMVTSVTHRALEPTQLFIDISTLEGKQTGLRQNSVVNAVHLLTVEKARIIHIIGNFHPSYMAKLNECLKAALELP